MTDWQPFKGTCPTCGHDHNSNIYPVVRLKSLVKELYAMRGEDELTTRICKDMEQAIERIM